jgi:hypothetical protein
MSSERVVLTRNGRAAAVLISPEDLPSSRSPSTSGGTRALADIKEADAAYLLLSATLHDQDRDTLGDWDGVVVRTRVGRSCA